MFFLFKKLKVNYLIFSRKNGMKKSRK